VRLADRGIASTVYEASGRAGGRMFSNTSTWADNQVTEWCGELIDTGHSNIRKLVHRFNLQLDDLIAAQPLRTEDTYFFQGHFYPQAQAAVDFAPVFEAVTADEAAAPFPTTFDNFTAAARELDNMSVFDWIESRVPGGHNSPLGLLLDTAYEIEYGAESTEQSSLNLIYFMAFQPENDTLTIFGESDERFHIRGGNQQLPRRMADSLGPTVEFGHRRGVATTASFSSSSPSACSATATAMPTPDTRPPGRRGTGASWSSTPAATSAMACRRSRRTPPSTSQGSPPTSTAPCSRSRRSTPVCQASGTAAPPRRSPTRAP
jgi:monoamine oxidase